MTASLLSLRAVPRAVKVVGAMVGENERPGEKPQDPDPRFGGFFFFFHRLTAFVAHRDEENCRRRGANRSRRRQKYVVY